MLLKKKTWIPYKLLKLKLIIKQNLHLQFWNSNTHLFTFIQNPSKLLIKKTANIIKLETQFWKTHHSIIFKLCYGSYNIWSYSLCLIVNF